MGKRTALVKLRKEIKDGKYRPYVHRNKVYLEDTSNEECIMICDLNEVDKYDKKVF